MSPPGCRPASPPASASSCCGGCSVGRGPHRPGTRLPPRSTPPVAGASCSPPGPWSWSRSRAPRWVGSSGSRVPSRRRGPAWRPGSARGRPRRRRPAWRRSTPIAASPRSSRRTPTSTGSTPPSSCPRSTPAAGRCGSPAWSTGQLELGLDDLLAHGPRRASTSRCRACRTRSAATWSATRGGRACRSPTLLDRAGVQPGATQIVGRSVDGFTAGFPTEAAFDGRPAMVAVGMNGEPLPPEHGFPARLVVPGLYGYVSATKWLTRDRADHAGTASTATGSPGAGPRRGRSRPSPASTCPAAARRAGRADRDRRRGVGADPRHRAGRGAGRRRPWRRGPAVRRAVRQHLGPVGARVGRGPRSRTGSRSGPPTATGETQTAERAPPAPDGATGWHTVQVQVGVDG